MRNQVLRIVALGIALAISPAASFARGGGGGGGVGVSAAHFSTSAAGVSGSSSSSGSSTPSRGAPYGHHPTSLGGGTVKGSSKPINCQAGGGAVSASTDVHQFG